MIRWVLVALVLIPTAVLAEPKEGFYKKNFTSDFFSEEPSADTKAGDDTAEITPSKPASSPPPAPTQQSEPIQPSRPLEQDIQSNLNRVIGEVKRPPEELLKELRQGIPQDDQFAVPAPTSTPQPQEPLVEKAEDEPSPEVEPSLEPFFREVVSAPQPPRLPGVYVSLIVKSQPKPHLLQQLEKLQRAREQFGFTVGEIYIMGIKGEAATLPKLSNFELANLQRTLSTLSVDGKAITSILDFLINGYPQWLGLVESLGVHRVEEPVTSISSKYPKQSSPTWVVQANGKDYVFPGDYTFDEMLKLSGVRGEN